MQSCTWQKSATVVFCSHENDPYSVCGTCLHDVVEGVIVKYKPFDNVIFLVLKNS